MAELVKWEYFKGAFKYVLGKRGDVGYSQDVGRLSHLDAAGAPPDDYIIRRVYDRLGNALVGVPRVVTVHTIDEAEYCHITGKIIDADGLERGEEIVEVDIHDTDEPQFVGDDGDMKFPQYIYTADTGEFELFLPRLKRFVIRIPSIRYKCWIEIPDESDKKITDLTVKTPLQLVNPF